MAASIRYKLELSQSLMSQVLLPNTLSVRFFKPIFFNFFLSQIPKIQFQISRKAEKKERKEEEEKNEEKFCVSKKRRFSRFAKKNCASIFFRQVSISTRATTSRRPKHSPTTPRLTRKAFLRIFPFKPVAGKSIGLKKRLPRPGGRTWDLFGIFRLFSLSKAVP